MRYFILFSFIFSICFSMDINLIIILSNIKNVSNPYMSLIEQKKTNRLNTLDETFSNYKLKLQIEANMGKNAVSGNSTEEQTNFVNANLTGSKIQPLIFGANGQVVYSIYQDKTQENDIDTYGLSQEVLLEYSQPLTIGGGVKKHYDLLVYPLQKTMILLNSLDEVNQYIYQVLSQYIDLLRKQQEISISIENIKNMETFNAISFQKYTKGNISNMEYTKTNIELSNTKLEHEKKLISKQINSQYFLDKVGLAQSLTLNISFNVLPEIPPEDITIDSVIVIQLKKLEIAKINYDIESIYGNQSPELNISGQFKKYNQATNYEESLNYSKTDWGLLGAFKFDFFDEGSTNQKAQNLKDYKTTLEQELIFLQTFYTIKLKELSGQLELMQKQVSLYETNKKLTNDIYKVDQKRYTDGAISYYEMLQSWQSLNNIEIQYAQTLYDIESTKIEILRILGKLVYL